MKSEFCDKSGHKIPAYYKSYFITGPDNIIMKRIRELRRPFKTPF